jgi:predicted RNase H-like HicB family nuclease
MMMIGDQNSGGGTSVSWPETQERSYAYRDAQFQAGGTRRKIVVTARRLPENIYMAVSEDIPGMTVEGRTRDEVAEEAREVARNLLELTDGSAVQEEPSFVFVFYD